jgi:hypothetical protein
MATAKGKAKKAAVVAVDVPKVLLEADEHAYLGKVKVALAKKASLTRMEALFEAVDLGWYLTARGRGAEAKVISDWIVAGVPFTGNHNLWSPAGAAICLRARLARLDQDETLRATLVKKLLENPAYATVARAQIDDKIARDTREVDAAAVEKSQKWACHKLSRALMGLSYFRETARHGFYYDDWIDLAALDTQIDRALALLRERLG